MDIADPTAAQTLDIKLLEKTDSGADENGVQEKKNVCLLKRKKFLQGNFNVAQGWSMVKRNRMRVC